MSKSRDYVRDGICSQGLHGAMTPCSHGWYGEHEVEPMSNKLTVSEKFVNDAIKNVVEASRYERALREVRARVITAENWINPPETLQGIIDVIDKALEESK
jgi:hypothetical protein